jgi:hypothetical protein
MALTDGLVADRGALERSLRRLGTFEVRYFISVGSGLSWGATRVCLRTWKVVAGMPQGSCPNIAQFPRYYT